MATAAKPRKKFRVAVSGNTVDGREIQPQHLRDAAANYDPNVYGARVNVEHILSPYPDSSFGALGDVISLSTEDITEGALAGRTALYAEIEPSDRMIQMTKSGQKIYSSIELDPQFALNGKAYVRGLAMTDTPASLGTERLKFAAQQRAQVMAFNNQQTEPPMFTEALEAELIELTAQQNHEGKQWFSRVMNIISSGRQNNGQQFSQMQQVIEEIAQSQSGLIDQFTAAMQQRTADAEKIQQLSTELSTLRQQLGNTPETFGTRPSANGGADQHLADY